MLRYMVDGRSDLETASAKRNAVCRKSTHTTYSSHRVENRITLRTRVRYCTGLEAPKKEHAVRLGGLARPARRIVYRFNRYMCTHTRHSSATRTRHSRSRRPRPLQLYVPRGRARPPTIGVPCPVHTRQRHKAQSDTATVAAAPPTRIKNHGACALLPWLPRENPTIDVRARQCAAAPFAVGLALLYPSNGSSCPGGATTPPALPTSLP